MVVLFCMLAYFVCYISAVSSILQHCQIVEDDVSQDWNSQLQPNDVTCISVQAFTPILGTLLLSPNGMVDGPARYAVVEILNRMRKADELEEQERDASDRQTRGQQEEEDQDEDDYPSGLFGKTERKMLRDEILQQVVIGMARLDASDEGEEQNGEGDEAGQFLVEIVDDNKPRPQDVVNPYFPLLPLDWTASSAASEPQAAAATLPSATDTLAISPTINSTGANAEASTSAGLRVSFAQLPVSPSLVGSYQPEDQTIFSPDWIPPYHQPTSPEPPIAKQERESKPDNEYHTDAVYAMDNDELHEQAAAGRLASMSLMAAVTASGARCFDY
jgi:serine/threonine-protein phosphatase 4 regulatory subunit 1